MAHKPLRVAGAILGGSFAATAITTLVIYLVNTVLTAGYQGAQSFSYANWFGTMFVLSALVACTLGLAWHALAARRGWTSVHAYWGPGALAGVTVALALTIGPALIAGAAIPPSMAAALAILCAYAAALGGLTGFFAWLIRRPDRDAPNPPTSDP